MSAVVYDAGALVAAERNDRRLWADHRVRLEAGVVPVVPAPIVAHGGGERRVMESTVLELTRDDILARIDQGARRRLDMSGVALLRAWREGHLADPGDVADLLALAALLADDDPALDGAGG